MTLDDVSVISVGQSATAVAALKYGKIDGIVNPDPVITKLVNDGDAVAILDSRTEQGARDLHGGYLASSAILTTPEFVARRPATAQAFANAIVRTLMWLRTASVEDIMADLPPEYFAGDRELYRQALIANRRNYSEDGRITTELASNTLALLKMVHWPVPALSISARHARRPLSNVLSSCTDRARSAVNGAPRPRSATGVL